MPAIETFDPPAKFVEHALLSDARRRTPGKIMRRLLRDIAEGLAL